VLQWGVLRRRSGLRRRDLCLQRGELPEWVLRYQRHLPDQRLHALWHERGDVQAVSKRADLRQWDVCLQCDELSGWLLRCQRRLPDEQHQSLWDQRRDLSAGLHSRRLLYPDLHKWSVRQYPNQPGDGSWPLRQREDLLQRALRDGGARDAMPGLLPHS
jgi:hypothetical protein